jgi:hypothetical protein
MLATRSCKSPELVTLRISFVEGPVKLLQEVGGFLGLFFLGGRYGEVLPCHSWVMRKGIGLQVHGNVTSKHVNLVGLA